MKFLIRICFVIFAFLQACRPDLPDDVAEAYGALPEKLDYNEHVKPVLSDKCFACHGPDKAKQKAGLRLDLAEGAYAALKEHPDKVAIEPGSLSGSEFFRRIMSSDPDEVMPTPSSHLTLSPEEKAVLIKWIEDGAEYKPHWAFVAPRKEEIPEVGDDTWPKNALDHFVLAKLEKERLKPSPEASKELLLRRLSLDLTGLPPTLMEIDAFLADKSPKAYEKQVDRLLASPHYGEKMAVDWLDLARFADSHGYTVDRLRDMSPYRDWVISAFNKNQPYDQFLHWQLAGDLMPNPTRDMMVATAFNRNHQQNMEGGIVEEEFQTEYVVDRTNTFGDAMLGLSVGCAKCHDHKYDPISQKNYYQLFSFFNNVKEAGQISWDDALPTPTYMLPTKEQESTLRYIKNEVQREETRLADARMLVQPAFEKWLQTGGYKSLIRQKLPAEGLQAFYTFEQNGLANTINRKEQGVMKRESGQAGGEPVFENTNGGRVLTLDGDVFLDLNQNGVFRKSEPFTIGARLFIPGELHEGVIMHKSQAERLYNFRGYHIYLKNDRLEFNMAHTAPSNALTRVSKEPVPKNKWIHLTASYDGSSRASGLRLFLDGREIAMETTMDQLTREILFKGSVQPGLQIGGWWRGLGFKGGKIDDISVYNRTLTSYEIAVLGGATTWAKLLSTAPLTPEAKSALGDYYFAAVDASAKAVREELKKVRTRLTDSTQKVQEIMVMQEMPKPKKSFVLLRGNYDSPGEEVFPNTPEAILSFPKKLPKNRYGLAQWLTTPQHPLTARVAVNRFWQNFFGTGIVKTTEDFGNQGELPSHRQLLDWMAVDFRESGWDVKKLCKLIVMSATYRQDSRSTPESREKDPENRLLSHGPVNRMTAEMIRDNALMASGLINRRLGGKSVKPYQPDGLWEINSSHYKADSGDAVYRRSLYIIAKRSVPNPTLSTFDGTSRSFCVVRRQKTNTPLQALVTLNDPTFTEASRALGAQMMRAGSNGIVLAYRKLTGRKPGPKETALLEDLRATELARFRKDPQKMKGWLSAGQYMPDAALDKPLLAANTVVANTILNSDATLTKR